MKGITFKIPATWKLETFHCSASVRIMFLKSFLQVFISRYDPDSSLQNLGSWIRIQPVLLAGIYIYFVWQLFYCEICGVSVKYKKEHINKTHQIDVETYTELIEKRSRGEEIASHLPGSYHAQCCGSKWQIPCIWILIRKFAQIRFGSEPHFGTGYPSQFTQLHYQC